jgi:GNAT superfamily N-acetyltransferase
MLRIEIRQGTTEDAMVITDLIKKMVLEMAQYGGHAVNESQADWSSMEELVKTNSSSKEHLYLLASCRSPMLNIFVEKMRLHLSAIYTVPEARRQGVAGKLIKKVLEWGQQMNAVEADLHVLVANPARQLYEKLGFEPHEVSLVKKLN